MHVVIRMEHDAVKMPIIWPKGMYFNARLKVFLVCIFGGCFDKFSCILCEHIRYTLGNILGMRQTGIRINTHESFGYVGFLGCTGIS